MPTRLPLAAAVLAASLLVAGCRSDEPAPAPTATPGVVKAGDEYVAMGDSYTAGPRLGKEVPGCNRGSRNYPSLLAQRLDLRLTDVSCGGATSAAVYQPYTPPDGTEQPPQLDALSDTTDLVTFSFGGNDEHVFAKFLFVCVTMAAGSDDAPCTKADKEAGGALKKTIAGTTRRLTAALERVEAAAPTARIVVVSYPRFAPARRPCAQLPIADGDVGFANRLNRLLVAAQRKAAKAAGVEFVDVYHATQGHDMCARHPWLAGASPTAPAAPFHPYEKEQQVVAGLVADLLSQPEDTASAS